MMKKRGLRTFLTLITLILLILPVCAGGGFNLYYNNTAKTTTSFVISSSGLATVNLSYTGLQGVTSRATITTYLEKKTLGLLWTRVDLDNSSDKWVDTSTKCIYATSHSIQLNEEGSYRVT